MENNITEEATTMIEEKIYHIRDATGFQGLPPILTSFFVSFGDREAFDQSYGKLLLDLKREGYTHLEVDRSLLQSTQHWYVWQLFNIGKWGSNESSPTVRIDINALIDLIAADNPHFHIAIVQNKGL